MARKHNVDEVIKALTKKGIIITTDFPITKRVTKLVLPDKKVIETNYKRFLKDRIKEVARVNESLGEKHTNDYYFKLFKSKSPECFLPKKILKTVVVQEPFTINTSNSRNVGNKSWGKIDFLVNYNEFTLIMR